MNEIKRTAISFAVETTTAKTIHDVVNRSKASEDLRQKGVYLTTTDFLKVGILLVKNTPTKTVEKFLDIARDDERFQKELESMVQGVYV